MPENHSEPWIFRGDQRLEVDWEKGPHPGSLCDHYYQAERAAWEPWTETQTSLETECGQQREEEG
jgi:hypothetical protein